MLNSLKKINKIKTYKDIENSELWLTYLYSTREKNYNFGNLKALSELTNKNVFNYVKKSLEILNDEKIDDDILFYVEETLKWMEVAKCGSKKNRDNWLKENFELYVHNIGSSQIYKHYSKNYNEVIEILIKTHGLVGQYIKGEVNISKNKELYNLISADFITQEKLKKTLFILNKCLISAISKEIWESVQKEVEIIVNKIVNNQLEDENYSDEEKIIKRFLKLRKHTTKEELKLLRKLLEDEDLKNKIELLFNRFELWYIDSALEGFPFEIVLKFLYMISIRLENKNELEHISFENIMKSMYLDYKGNKTINIYKERIVENYINNLKYSQIKNSQILNKHISIDLNFKNKTVLCNINFSLAASKLIEFCEIAYGTDSIFTKAVFMLYDLFNFRRDEYDRFYNEVDYLKIMNDSLNKKAKILDYINGKSILDIGPGGGALLDMLSDKFMYADIYGIDISSNVIEELDKRKIKENKRWNIVKGDALDLSKNFKNGEIDTVIYSSIIHELFSYIPLNGEKFNYDTIKKALLASYNILPKGGRIIIRDGIMTEDKELNRIIKFKNKEDIKILEKYCEDFKGRKIAYLNIKENEVIMKVNDAMEFLYTYTWGEKSYSLEVKEQFGYFTPKEYVEFIKNIFKDKCKIIECIHFLQDGYEEHLLEKIDFYDENYVPVQLPDSTCIIVVEKI